MTFTVDLLLAIEFNFSLLSNDLFYGRNWLRMKWRRLEDLQKTQLFLSEKD